MTRPAPPSREPSPDRSRERRQRGVAIITALLTVALVAALAVAAFWSQWRGIEMESAQRQHLQDDWLLGGALDWGRARLHADALSQGSVDHLNEAWAQPVRDAPLAGFLVGRDAGEPLSAAPAGEVPPLFLSLRISDAQGRLNLLNLLEGPALSPAWMGVFGRLFSQLGLPAAQLSALAEQLRLAQASVQAGSGSTATAPLLPQQASQLAWLGLPAETATALQAHVTLLPGRTPVNLNTASVEVLQAVLPDLSRAAAEQLVARRARQPFTRLNDTGLSKGLDEMLHSVNSRFFELRVELRSQPGSAAGVAHNALLQRERADVRVLWLRPGSLSPPSAPARPPP